ncbi:uncharacterized protein LOC122498886 [Leptopilina heterotoma]|uniref:uncharacterized protein LOC122498886 n=1 Tax=Leptopilina heterotoma TaxID=63436 RepID=UPI001CA9487A|nr:uncharacterized protein LOC122498886 [Leptopilina heterotoma]XP_043462817.1 uncharacterized protein LOC122498886 [Leptopilina heterotoma]
MMKIVFACLLIPLVAGAIETLGEDELKILEKALHQSAEFMMKEVEDDEHVAICIGATRSGKSTLINYLKGNSLEAVREPGSHQITLRVITESSGPEVSSGPTSKTTSPTKWFSENLPDLAIWDAPGFDDNRGAIQDITNSFYLYQLVQNVKSLKIILVVDINDILNDNIKPFLTVLEAVETLLGNKMKNYFSIITVVFTKVRNIDDVPIDMHFINEKLTYQFLSSNDMQMSSNSKDFVRFLIANNYRIAFFKRPLSLGRLKENIDMNIFASIRNSKSIPKNTLKELHPRISDSSKLSLYNLRDKLSLISEFSKFENIVTEIFLNKVDDVMALATNEESEKKLTNVIEKLDALRDKLSDAKFHEKDIIKKVKILRSANPAFEKEITSRKLLEKIKLMEFVDKLSDVKEGEVYKLAHKLKEFLSNSISNLNNAIFPIRKKLDKIRQDLEESFVGNLMGFLPAAIAGIGIYFGVPWLPMIFP